MKERFLSIDYLRFSLKLKINSFLLKKFNTTTPYVKYVSDVKKINHKHKYKKNLPYTSLNHTDYKTAKKFYGENSLITVQLILALVYWNEENRDDYFFITLVEEIIGHTTETDQKLSLILTFPLQNYTFHKERVSGLVQGKLLSLLVRAYWLTGSARYKKLAEKCLDTMTTTIENGGALRRLNDDYIWIEEYADIKQPSMVLNGHLFTIISIADYLSINDDNSTRDLYNKLINTTLAFLPFYYQKNNLLYSLKTWNLCNVHYLGIMQPLTLHIYNITEVKEFLDLNTMLQKQCPNDLFKKLMSL